MSPRTTPPHRPAPDEGAGSRPAPLRVLTFGWEFAPILSGGLGVACAGLVKALVAEGADVTFVLPKMPKPIEVDGVKLVNATAATGLGDEAVAEPGTIVGAPNRGRRGSLSTWTFDTLLAPYQGPRAYAETLSTFAGTALATPQRKPAANSRTAPVGDSLYGGDLAAEVERLAAAAVRIAAETPHDIIHCHDWMTFAAGVRAREVSGKPLVLHVHSTEADRSGGGPGNADIRAREEAGLKAADLIVAVSDFTRAKILEQYDVDPDRIRVVHNGIDKRAREEEQLDLPPLAGLRPIVLFLGRLTAQKGPEWFLAAAELVHRVRPDALFVVAGSGGMLPWMIEEAARRGLAASFLFTGFLSGDDIARAYAMADVFVMPSVSEPFGLVPIEAMLRGTPAIVSRQSGVSEVIRHCLKVDFWDTRDLADKIVGVLEHPALATMLGGEGLAEVARLGWEGPARRLFDVFAGTLAERTTRQVEIE